MAEVSYKKLQNGSDIRGIALAGIEGETPNLTAAEAEKLTAGFLCWLSAKWGKKVSELTVAIGRDPRLSGEELLEGAILGMLPYGVHVLDCGLASTPAMFMTTIFPEYGCDGAIMITASHLPFNRNGFKYFDRAGGLNKTDIADIISYADAGKTPDNSTAENIAIENRTAGNRIAESRTTEKTAALSRTAEKREAEHRTAENRTAGNGAAENSTAGSIVDTNGMVEKRDLLGTYSAFLREKIKTGVAHPTKPDQPLSGLHIVVDAGNGSGGFYPEQVLAPLGADISGSQFLEPDGSFPNHAPNPEDKAAMHAVSQAVLRGDADFGLIFDTDVDRSSAVDRNGREINRNGIVAMAAALVAEDHPGTTVVTDSITSDQLTVFIEKELGLHHRRFKRGYKNVINEAIRLNREGTDSQLAIETSGHAALAENYFLDDGAYLATKIVIKAAKLRLEGCTLDSIIAGLEEPKEAVEVRFPIKTEEFASYGDKVLTDLAAFVKEEGSAWGMALVEPNYEGVRISFDKAHGDGWCLLRKSLHDPIMPLNIESNLAGGCAQIAEALRSFLTGYDKLDSSKL